MSVFLTWHHLWHCLCISLPKKTYPSASFRVQHTYHWTTLPRTEFEYYSTWVIFWCGFYRWGRSCTQQIKESAKQKDNVASKEVQQVKERYHPSRYCCGESSGLILLLVLLCPVTHLSVLPLLNPTFRFICWIILLYFHL